MPTNGPSTIPVPVDCRFRRSRTTSTCRPYSLNWIRSRRQTYWTILRSLHTFTTSMSLLPPQSKSMCTPISPALTVKLIGAPAPQPGFLLRSLSRWCSCRGRNGHVMRCPRHTKERTAGGDCCIGDLADAATRFHGSIPGERNVIGTPKALLPGSIMVKLLLAITGQVVVSAVCTQSQAKQVSVVHALSSLQAAFELQLQHTPVADHRIYQPDR